MGYSHQHGKVLIGGFTMRIRALVGSMLVGAVLPVTLVGMVAGASSALLVVMVGALVTFGCALIASSYVSGVMAESATSSVVGHTGHLSS